MTIKQEIDRICKKQASLVDLFYYQSSHSSHKTTDQMQREALLMLAEIRFTEPQLQTQLDNLLSQLEPGMDEILQMIWILAQLYSPTKEGTRAGFIRFPSMI
jgi:hypothetical protein